MISERWIGLNSNIAISGRYFNFCFWFCNNIFLGKWRRCTWITSYENCVKSVQIGSLFGPYFLLFRPGKAPSLDTYFSYSESLHLLLNGRMLQNTYTWSKTYERMLMSNPTKIQTKIQTSSSPKFLLRKKPPSPHQLKSIARQNLIWYLRNF